MTTKVEAGYEQFRATRVRGEKLTGNALARTSTGRGQLLRRAKSGDQEARDLLTRHGHDPNLGGDAA